MRGITVPDGNNVPGDKHIEQQRTEQPTVIDSLARAPRPGDPSKTPVPTDAAGKRPDDKQG
jgi:hypothetical protein